MEEFPEDVRQAVDSLLDAALAAGDDVSTEQMMARGIMAERERCVALVSEFRETTTEGRAELTAAIRRD